MLKKLLIASIILCIMFMYTEVYAMAPETYDVVKRSLDITEGFDRPMRGGNEELARTFYTECRGAYDKLYDYLQKNKEKDKNGNIIEFLPTNDRACIHYAATVVVMRLYALTDYIISAEAFKNKEYRLHRKMSKICSRDWQLADSYRLGFRNTYGF